MRRVPIPTVFTTHVAAMILFALLTHPVRSEAIPVTGAVSGFRGSGGEGSGALTGPLGFSLRATRRMEGSADQCFTVHSRMVDLRCHPGDRITLSALWDGLTSGSVSDFATFRGVTYNMGLFPCGWPDPSAPPCPSADVSGTFTAFDVIAPSLEIGPTFSVEGPFVFAGTFTYSDPSPGGTSGEEPLTGRGRATLVLVQGHFVDGDDPLWLLDHVAYDFAAPVATPEPATLLLFGTTATGLGVARWLKRRRAA